jgi:hypothetical protein
MCKETWVVRWASMYITNLRSRGRRPRKEPMGSRSPQCDKSSIASHRSFLNFPIACRVIESRAHVPL